MMGRQPEDPIVCACYSTTTLVMRNVTLCESFSSATHERRGNQQVIGQMGRGPGSPATAWDESLKIPQSAPAILPLRDA